MSPKTPAHTPNARDRLLDAALTLIRAQGYSATTVDHLCAEAKVTKGAFFHHFKSKEDLGVSAARHWSVVTDSLFAAADYRKHADPLDRVLGYIDLRSDLLRGPTAAYTCLVGTMVQETYQSSPAIRDACHASLYGHAADVARDVEAARKLYAPHAPWSAESLALHIQGVVQGAFILVKAGAKSGHDSSIAAESISHLRRYVELLFKRKSLPERKPA